MRTVPVLLVAATLLIAATAGAAAQPAPAVARDPSAASVLPGPEQWLAHFVRDLLPYWSSPQALGEPVGRFPTFRYPDGEPIRGEQLLRPGYRGLSENAPWLGLRVGRTYTRMISRQAYALGVAFHLTGDGRYLAAAKAAVDHVLEELADEGTFCSWVERGECRPAPPRRTAQDLAYALLGPASYAYLTGDPEVLDAVVRAHRRFFDAWRDPETGLVRWVLEASEDPPDSFSPEQVELVAQLDPVNAYLLLLAPVVPEAHREPWLADLASLSELLAERFYSPQHNVFWGRIDAPEYRRFGGHHHTDTGHTAKAFWMLERTARLTGDEELAALARDGARRFLDAVWLPQREDSPNPWAGGWNEEGAPVGGAIWWAFAELDQLTATLALAEPALARRLPRAYEFWLTHFVDHQHGGAWPFPVAPGEQPPIFKAHLWKNGYHEAEHALVGYVAANALRGAPVHLYFARPEGDEAPTSQPYVFDGDAETVRRLPLAQLPGYERVEVRFENVR